MADSGNATTSIDPAELTVLTIVGHNLVEDVGDLLCETIWWAGYAVLFLFALYIQFKTGLRSAATIIMLCVTLLLFSSCTTLWAMSVTVMFKRINARLIDNPTWPLDQRYQYSEEQVHAFGVPMETLFMLNLLVGDLVVIWRAAVLWTGARKVIALPLVTFCTSFAFAVIAITCLMEDGYGSKSAIPNGSRTCTWAEPLAWALSLLTNIISTSLIAYKAWMHRQFIKKNLGFSTRRTRTEKVMVLLVESGFLYCLFWIFQVIDFIDISRGTKLYWLYAVVSTMGDQISGVYPTLIIILVNLQQTVWDASTSYDFGRGSSGTGRTLRTVEFAHNTDTETTGGREPMQLSSFAPKDRVMISQKQYWSEG